MAAKKKSGPEPERRPRVSKSTHHDTYARRAKNEGAVVCKRCGVVHHGGKWSWGKAAGETRAGLCPACERIRDHYPAGTIRLDKGLLEFRDEIKHLIANVEELEKVEHPLERVMDIQESANGMVVTTTGLHVARRITSKLERRFHKKARIRYPKEQSLMQVEL
jgi:NMD protein affecting ribosome stability and mRNA decay